VPAGSFLARLRRMFSVFVPSLSDSSAWKLVALAGVVVFRVALSDRQAHINGHTVNYLLRNDTRGFIGLVGQRCASSYRILLFPHCEISFVQVFNFVPFLLQSFTVLAVSDHVAVVALPYTPAFN
jgi:hypothetical protein